MTSTKYFDETIRGKTSDNSKVVIDADDYGEDPAREWICPHCNFILHARKSRGEVDCHHCKATVDLGVGKVQERQAIEDPNKNVPTETFAATTPGTEYFIEQVRIKKEPELKSGFKALRDKGLKITNYKEGVG